MNAITRGVKATYNFFAGDAIILTFVLVAFVLDALLIHLVHAPNVLVAVLFIALIGGGLVITLGRELVGRPRVR